MNNSDNSSNSSIPTNGEQLNNSVLQRIIASDIIQIPLLSLTIILAIAYTVLILIRPTFRRNKLNWFTVNLCLTSLLLSIILLSMCINQLLNISSPFSCRAQAFFVNMASCQLMYSHSVASISRLLAIVYANKHIFRSNVCLWGCIGSGWLIAVLVTLPYLFIDGFTCVSSTQAALLPYYALITILILPVVIVAVCNCRILQYVRKSTRQVHAEGGRGQVSHARDVRLLKILISNFVIFLIGWAPLFITQTFDKTNSISKNLAACFQVLQPLSMLSEVLLLMYTNQPVRLFLKQLLVRSPQVLRNNNVRTVHPN